MGVTDVSHEWADGTTRADGITVYKDGTWKADGFTHYKNGDIEDPDGNLHHLDGTWEDRDHNVHNPDHSWQDDEDFTHYDNGSVTTPQGVNVAQDGSSVVFPTQDITGSTDNSDPYSGYVDPSENAADTYDNIDPTYWSDEYGAQTSTSDDSTTTDNTPDDHSDDHPDDIYDDAPVPADPPTPDDPSGSTPDPDGGGDETPAVGKHVHAARGSSPGHHGSVGGEVDGAGGGYGWTHFGAPRSDDGDNGEEKPSLGHRSKAGRAGHGPKLPGSGLQGSTGDQDYVGGGYGWNLHGAPRADVAIPGAGGSVASVLDGGGGGRSAPPQGGLTEFSEGTGPADGKGRRPRHRRGRVAFGLLVTALATGALAGTVGRAGDSVQPAAPLVVASSSTAAPVVIPAMPIPPVVAPTAPTESTAAGTPAPAAPEIGTAPRILASTVSTGSAPQPTFTHRSAVIPVVTGTQSPPPTPNQQHHRTAAGAPHVSIDAAPHVSSDSVPRDRAGKRH